MTIEQSQDGGCATRQRGQDYGHRRNGFKARQEGQEAIERGWEIRIEAAACLATLDQEWRQPGRIGDLLGKVGLRRGQGGLEIRESLALAEMERGINLQRQMSRDQPNSMALGAYQSRSAGLSSLSRSAR
jgi:hypothetical protein